MSATWSTCLCLDHINLLYSIIQWEMQQGIVSHWGKPSFKKYRNFMKNFHKTVTRPPRTTFMKSYSDFLQILGELLFLNKRYEIRLTLPPCLWIFFIKFRYFLKDCFPKFWAANFDTFATEINIKDLSWYVIFGAGYIYKGDYFVLDTAYLY